MKVVAAAQQLSSRSPRLFITERNSKISFLVDSGSDVSVLSKKEVREAITLSKYTIYAVNHTPIKTYGCKTLCLQLGLQKEYPWNLVIADTEVSILGADFLKKYHLLPDLQRELLLDGDSLCHVKGDVKETSQISISSLRIIHHSG